MRSAPPTMAAVVADEVDEGDAFEVGAETDGEEPMAEDPGDVGFDGF